VAGRAANHRASHRLWFLAIIERGPAAVNGVRSIGAIRTLEQTVRSGSKHGADEDVRLLGDALEQDLCGLLNLDKPAGVTSRWVVDVAARAFRGHKVGHAGTLDPLATGVLVICVGKATRLIEYVQKMPKTYRTVVRLGALSNTLDADGDVIEVESPPIPSEA